MSTDNFFCIAPLGGEACNYPIGVIMGEGIYTDNDPASPKYGEAVVTCPGCKRLLSHFAWDGVDRDIDRLLAKEPEPKSNLVFPR